MEKLKRSGLQLGVGIILGLALLAAMVVVGQIGGIVFTLIMLALGISVLLGLAVVVVAGLLGAILIPLAVFGVVNQLSQPPAPCSGQQVAVSTPHPASKTATAPNIALDYFNRGDSDFDQGNCLQGSPITARHSCSTHSLRRRTTTAPNPI